MAIFRLDFKRGTNIGTLYLYRRFFLLFGLMIIGINEHRPNGDYKNREKLKPRLNPMFFLRQFSSPLFNVQRIAGLLQMVSLGRERRETVKTKTSSVAVFLPISNLRVSFGGFSLSANSYGKSKAFLCRSNIMNASRI